MKKLIFTFILVHGLAGSDVSINTDQISEIGARDGVFNVCGNHTMIRFYNGDSTCVEESPSEMQQLIVTK